MSHTFGMPQPAYPLMRTVALKNAQIKTLATTPIELVPAPGPGRMVIPTLATLQMIWAADYTNISTNSLLQIRSSSTALGLLNLDEQLGSGAVSSFLANGGDGFVIMGPTSDVNGAFNAAFAISVGNAPADWDNTRLELFLVNDDGDLTGGDDANRLIVNVEYRIWPLHT